MKKKNKTNILLVIVLGSIAAYYIYEVLKMRSLLKDKDKDDSSNEDKNPKIVKLH